MLARGARAATGKASSPSAPTRRTTSAAARAPGSSSRSSGARSSSSAAGPSRATRASTSAPSCSATTTTTGSSSTRGTPARASRASRCSRCTSGCSELERKIVAVQHDAEDQRGGALDAAGGRRRDQVQRVDRPTESFAIRCSSACATTRRRATWCTSRSRWRSRECRPSARASRPAQRVGRVGEDGSARRATIPRPRARACVARSNVAAASRAVAAQLEEIERRRRRGNDRVVGRHSSKCRISTRSSFPTTKQTKGDVMRYYARIAPLLLPAIADRPLVMKRFPERHHGQGVLSAARAGRCAGAACASSRSPTKG